MLIQDLFIYTVCCSGCRSPPGPDDKGRRAPRKKRKGKSEQSREQSRDSLATVSREESRSGGAVFFAPPEMRRNL